MLVFILCAQAVSVFVGGCCADAQECAVEGSRVFIAAHVGDFRDGVCRVLQKRTGAVDAQRIDVLAEIDFQLLREDVRQMDAADAQRAGSAFKRKRFGIVFGNVVQHLVREAGMDIFIHCAKRHASEKIGQKDMQIAEFQGAVLLQDDFLQLLIEKTELRSLLIFCDQRTYRYHRSESVAEFADGFRLENKGNSLRIFRHHVITVRNRGKCDNNIAVLQGKCLGGHGHSERSGQEKDDFYHIMHMRRERMIAACADKNGLLALLVKYAFDRNPTLLNQSLAY